MTHVVDHACECHSVEEAPDQKQEVCEKHPDRPVLVQQGINKLLFGIENRPIEFEHGQIGERKIGEHDRRAGDHALSISRQKILGPERSFPTVLFGALEHDAEQPARALAIGGLEA